MATLAEIAEGRRVRDQPIIEMVKAGRTAKQIAQALGLAPGTIRHRVQKYGLKCVTWQDMAGVAQKEPARMSKPCKCDGVCKSIHSNGHRFGPDLTCACGTSWHVHQRHPVECPTSKRPECVSALEDQCVNGHPPKDLYVSPKGKRQCRQCRIDNDRRRNERRTEKRQAEKLAAEEGR